MDTQTQIDRLIELAIVQRTELKQLVEQLPQLREHLNAEVERTIEEVEPQLRAELEEFCDKRSVDANAKLGSALEAKIVELSKALELTTQARYNAIKEQERKVDELRQLAAKQIEGHVAALPEAVKEIVGAELARFPRAGEIDQLRKEFAEPRGLNPRGKWLPSETYQKLDLVTWNGDSYVSNIDGNRERPARNSSTWTLSAARGIGGGGPSDLSALTAVPSNGSLLIGSGTSWVNGNIVAGAGINVTNGAGSITISATDGDITLDDGTAASPSLHFTNDADTGIYRPAANTLGISVSGTQVAYFDQNGLTIPNAGIEAGGSLHAANGNANNPSLSFTGDQDTGFFRHQPNELGVALGGTQYATLTSTTFSVTPALSVAGVARVTNSTASSSTSTGALVVTGGVGIGGAANVGGNLTVAGKVIGGNASDSGAISTLRSAGTADAAANVKARSALTVTDNQTSNTDSAMVFGINGTGAYIQGLYTTVGSTITLQPYGGGTTLGGNLTVSGTGTSTFTSNLTLNGSKILTVNGSGNLLQLGDGTGTVSFAFNRDATSSNSNIFWRTAGSNKWAVGVGINAVGEDFEFFSYPALATVLKLDSSKGKLTQSPTLNANADNGALWSPTITPLSGNIYINRSYATINSGASAGGFITEFTAGSLNSGTSNIASIEGFTAGGGNSGASGTMTSYTGFRSSPANTSTGSVTNVYGFRAQNVYNPSGYVGNQYGVYVDALTGAANNYAFYSAGAGIVSIGDTTNTTGAGSGALQVAGGAYVAKAIYAAGNVTISKSQPVLLLTTTGTTDASVRITTSNSDFILGGNVAGLVSGGYNLYDALYGFNVLAASGGSAASGKLTIGYSTASSTSGTGSLVVTGGVGISGATNVGTYYGMVDGITAPAATSGYAKIYVDTADGDLKVIFGDGTIKTIVTD